MLKVLLLLTFTFGTAYGAPMYERLEKLKYPFSALNIFFKETYQKKLTSKHLRAMERILSSTGVEVLDDYDIKTLEFYKTPSTHFILARKYLEAKNLNKAMEYANLVEDDHELYAETEMIKAQIFAAQNILESELDAYESCAYAARKRIKSEKEHYFRMLSEICVVNRTRALFREGKMQAAMNDFNRFPKNSYMWPYLLYERAWLYFLKGDYNRSSGLLITYKAPLLDTYFFPEAEYLAALNYFKLCLWYDSSIIIKQFYEAYRPRFLALEKILRENKNKPNYFFYMLFKRDDELKVYEKFVRQMVIRMKKQPRFSLGFQQIKLLNSEIKRIKKTEKKKVQALLNPYLIGVRSNLVSKLDNYAKLDIFNFLKSVRFFSNELFKMNLEIISRKKDLIYENKKLIANRSRGDYSNVKRDRFEYFWTFDGPFWADELGDYSLGLKSNCKVVDQEKK